MNRFLVSLLFACSCFLLSGCGGSSNGQNNQQPQQPSSPNPPSTGALGPSRKNLLFGFFGSDDSSAETFSFVNCMFENCWGDVDWNNPAQTISRLLAAKNAGVTKYILAVDWCMFEKSGRYTYLSDPIAKARLTGLLSALQVHNLLEGLVALYIVDEPEIAEHDCSESDLAAACAACLSVAATFPELVGVRLAVCYGQGQDYRGLQTFRPGLIGVDAYGQRDQILQAGGLVSNLAARLQEDQQLLLFPGGCDSNDSTLWRADPVPFYSFAQENMKVAGIIPFIWIDGWGGFGKPGIRSNGMAPAYKQVGEAIKNA